MKMFKKLLAVALAGVLALSVLTGCDKTNSQTLADAMSKAAGTTVTADTTLDTSAKSVYDAVVADVENNTALWPSEAARVNADVVWYAGVEGSVSTIQQQANKAFADKILVKADKSTIGATTDFNLSTAKADDTIPTVDMTKVKDVKVGSYRDAEGNTVIIMTATKKS